MITKKYISTFIKEHDYKEHCEAIIDREGLVGYAEPSHTYALIEETGKTIEELRKEQGETESLSDTHWLVERTGCVAVWFNFLIVPQDMTKEQISSINKLRECKIIL